MFFPRFFLSMFAFFLLFFFPSLRCAIPEKKTVCLNMIVKDEKNVILRCLTSALPFIDYWVIVDTGSKDGTQEAIKDFFQKHKIPGELHERPWVGFSHNRNEALALAKNKADYLLFMDADDMLSPCNNFSLPSLTEDFYILMSKTAKEDFWSPRFVKSSLNWSWEGIIHESLSCSDAAQGVPLNGLTYLYNQDGCRSKDPDTWKKDEKLLLQSIQEDPEDPRNYFYLARTYMNQNMLDLALNYFTKRASLQGNLEELFTAKLLKAKIQASLKQDSQIVEKSFFDAFLCRPHRLEPLYYLVSRFRQAGNYQKGYEIASLALKLPSNTGDYYYIEKWVYEFALLFEYACCAIHCGHYDESLEACNKLLLCPSLPEVCKKDVENWIAYIDANNIEKTKEKLISLIDGVLNHAPTK